MTDDPNVPIEPEPIEPPAAEIPVGSGAPEPDFATSAEQESAAGSTAAGPTAGQAWGEVVEKLSELGDAFTAWAKAAADTPENRKHIDEVRNGVNDMARQANEAFASVSSSDFGRQVAEGATRAGTTIGDTAQEFGQAAAPHVATAFAGLADAFGRAAQKVGEAAAPPKAPDPDARQAPEPPQAAATPMPPAQAEDEAGSEGDS